MNAKVVDILTTLAGSRIESEGKARNALAAEAADMTKALTPYVIREAMQAAADAMPYRILIEDQSDSDPAKVFLKLRRVLTRQLIKATSSTSTCEIANIEDRLKWDGVRRFLQDTAYLVDALNIPEGSAPTPEPAKPVPARRPTAAQRKALELIAAGGVRRTQFGLSNRERIRSEGGVIYADTFEVLLRERWAELDTSKSLFQGQPVSLTDAGRAHLSA